MTSASSQKSSFPPRIGVITNPLSGRNRRRPEILSSIISHHPEILLKNVLTPEDIHGSLTEFGHHNVNLLIINGGDGTVQAVMTDLFNHTPFATPPEIMVLAGGTTNMIAGDVGVLGKQDKALHRLLQWAKTGSGSVTRLQRPILRLQVPGNETKYGMFFGAASISQGTQYYHNNLHHKGLHGFPGICMTIARFLWAVIWQRNRFVTPTQITVRSNNRSAETDDFMLLFVTTLDRFFFGLRPFWGTENGRLKLTAVKSGARHLPWVLPFLARGRRAEKGTPENGYSSHNTDEVTLYMAESIVLDGELYTPKSKEQPTVLQYGGDLTFLQI